MVQLKMEHSRLLMAIALCFLMSSSHGIRLPRELKSKNVKNSNSCVKELAICTNDGSCSSSSSGKDRNLTISTSPFPSADPTTSTSSENLGQGPTMDSSPRGVAEDLASATASSMSKAILAKNEDNVEDGDITEMDYSPAKRKPPIHN